MIFNIHIQENNQSMIVMINDTLKNAECKKGELNMEVQKEKG
jgi:hypothetical protein